MSDMHILAGDGGRKWTVVAHISVPDANNSALVNWRTALVASGLGGITQLPDGDGTGGTISAAEKAQIEAGEVVETTYSFPIEGNGTDNAVIRDALRTAYTATKDRFVAELQAKLKYFGHTEEES